MAILSIKKRPVEMSISFFEVLLSNQKMIAFLQIVLSSCFIGICAQIKIPLHFTPVPLTVQTASIMLIGALLGSRKGVLAVLCYLIQGCVGLPVWAGGAAGFFHCMGPTGGYLIAYIAQVYFIGWILERQSNINLTKIACAFLLSIWLQLGIGTLWLAQFVGIKHCFMLGFYPFILSEMTKAYVIATSIHLRGCLKYPLK